MTYKDPNTYLRNGYLSALSGVGVPVFTKKIPVGATIPLNYILITSQTLNPTERSKDSFEWSCSVTIDVIYNGPAGMASPIQTEQIEANVITAIESGISVANFDVKSTIFVQSTPLDEETPTQYIERRVIVYEHWLCHNN